MSEDKIQPFTKVLDCDQPFVQISSEGYIYVEGLKIWLDNLASIHKDGPYLCVEDKDTGDRYEIRKIVEET